MLVKKNPAELVEYVYFGSDCLWVHYNFVKFIYFDTRLADNFRYDFPRHLHIASVFMKYFFIVERFSFLYRLF